jgi:predicted phosphodiesterase
VRIAAISDVHGNLPALEAALEDIGTQDVDVVVNLGDLLSGAVQPRETADRLMKLDVLTVAGNHERQLLTLPRESMGASDRLAHDTIDARHRTWMARLPLTLEPVEGVLAFHGSPTDDLVYLLETVAPDGARPATETEVLDRLGSSAGVPLLLCGHTHLQRAMRLPTGALVLNPGSVGWPAYDDDAPHPHVMEAGTPHARYAIADDAGGGWTSEFRAVEYDWDAAAAIAEGNGRPDVARALRTGRVDDRPAPR